MVLGVISNLHAQSPIKISSGFLILLSLLLTVAHSDSCISVPIDNQKSCHICLQDSQFQSCTLNQTAGSVSLNKSSCVSQCCIAKPGDSLPKIPFCQNNTSTYFSSSQASDSSVGIFLIIIFFSIPGIMCIYCTCSFCLQKRREWVAREQQREEQQQMQIDLQGYDIQEIGPYYIQVDQNCSICLDDHCDIITKCAHKYHFQCLAAWVKKERICPMCKGAQINPIVYYCTGCFRSAKLGMITQSSHQQQNNQERIKCEQCKKISEGQKDQISLDMELEEVAEQQNKQGNYVQSSKDLVRN